MVLRTVLLYINLFAQRLVDSVGRPLSGAVSLFHLLTVRSNAPIQTHVSALLRPFLSSAFTAAPCTLSRYCWSVQALRSCLLLSITVVHAHPTFRLLHASGYHLPCTLSLVRSSGHFFLLLSSRPFAMPLSCPSVASLDTFQPWHRKHKIGGAGNLPVSPYTRR